jgi:hypothetical protein
MSSIQELHDQAMLLAEDAFFARRRGDFDLTRQKLQEAFPLEKEAALRAKEESIGEPTESVLLRSAATIALNAGMYQEAEKLACLALSGNPPNVIADELREVLIEVLIKSPLGHSLSQNENQPVMAGKTDTINEE